MSWSYTYDPQVWPAIFTMGLAIYLGGIAGTGVGYRGSSLRYRMPVCSSVGSRRGFGDIGSRSFCPIFLDQIPYNLANAYQYRASLLCPGICRIRPLADPPQSASASDSFATRPFSDSYQQLSSPHVPGYQVEEYLIVDYEIGNTLALVYANILGLLVMVTLVWLAVRSPQHRWPVAIMLFGMIGSRLLFFLANLYPALLGPGELVLGVIGLAFSMYSLAFFRYRVFDPFP